jgi:mono/diheme cytochrome c family protein
MRRLFVQLGLFSSGWLIALAGCDFPGRPKTDATIGSSNEISFETIFSQHCVACHGADGKLGPAPPLNDALFRAIVPRDKLELVIREGRKGTPMPAFGRNQGGPLSDEQVSVLVRRIKGAAATDKEAEGEKSSVNSRWGRVNPPPDNVPPYVGSKTEPQLSDDQFESIRTTTFARACAVCHGKHGEGTDGGGRIDDAALLALLSDQELRRIVITGRPDLGMPSFADGQKRGPDFKQLSDKETTDLVNLLSHWRDQPTASSAAMHSSPTSGTTHRQIVKE